MTKLENLLEQYLKSTEKILIKEYFVDNAKAFLLYSRPIKWVTVKENHVDDLIYHEDLEDEIEEDFLQTFGANEYFDIDQGAGWEHAIEFVGDYKKENGIWFVVVDLKDKTIYIRPNGTIIPLKVKKEIKDWAIENRYNPDFVEDIAIA